MAHFKDPWELLSIKFTNCASVSWTVRFTLTQATNLICNSLKNRRIKGTKPHTPDCRGRSCSDPSRETGRDQVFELQRVTDPPCTLWTYRWINGFGAQAADGVREGFYNQEKLTVLLAVNSRGVWLFSDCSFYPSRRKKRLKEITRSLHVQALI